MGRSSLAWLDPEGPELLSGPWRASMLTLSPAVLKVSSRPQSTPENEMDGGFERFQRSCM